MEERSKKTLVNTALNLLQQLATVVCGLILPVLIINHYGSAVNGTISSISQFLSYITLLESGVGGVIKSALYKPLANQDSRKLSGIVCATEHFFQTISKVFILYLLVVAVAYPFLVAQHFSWFFTFSLVIIISISIFAQYYFGLTYQLVIQADQKMYITSAVQIVTMMLNVVLTFVCVKLGAQIHVLKLVTAVVFVLRPLCFNYYVKKHYHIDKTVPPDKEAIKQRWDGLGQHIAFIIHSNTDVTVLTLFTNVLEVSVYTVYYNVVYGIVNVVNSFSNGISASIGNLLATDEKEKLNRVFDIYEVLNFLLISIFFTTTGLLILPFVTIYTAKVHDVNYYRPLFAALIVMSEAAYCLRNPYSTVVFAAGHFKQTTKGAYVEAAINIILSVIFVIKFGMVGVAIGTLTAMLFRSFQYVHYLSKHILYRPVTIFIKKMLLVASCVLLSIGASRLLPSISMTNYFYWVIYAVEVFVITTLITTGLFFVCYREPMKETLATLGRIFKRKG